MNTKPATVPAPTSTPARKLVVRTAIRAGAAPRPCNYSLK